MKFFCRQLYFDTIPLLKMFYRTSANEQYTSENTGSAVLQSVIKKMLNLSPFRALATRLSGPGLVNMLRSSRSILNEMKGTLNSLSQFHTCWHFICINYIFYMTPQVVHEGQNSSNTTIQDIKRKINLMLGSNDVIQVFFGSDVLVMGVKNTIIYEGCYSR